MSSGDERGRRAERLRGRRGVNYLPSWARGPHEHWTSALRRDVLEREVGLAAALGFDHLRVWVNAPAWEREPLVVPGSLRLLADTCERNGLGLVVQLFDSCGIEPDEPVLDPAIRLGDVPRLAPDDPRTAILTGWDGGRRDVFGKPGLVPVAWRGDPIVGIWEGWVPSPGYRLLGPEHWARWDAYARSVLATVADHPALLLVELMNEPWMSQIGTNPDRAPIVAFYRHVHEVVRSAAPDVPLAIGAERAAHVTDHEADIGERLDVVSFHSYDGGDALRAELDAARAVADGRPLYLSEWGWFPGGTDDEQRAGYDDRLAILGGDDASDVAWATFHLVAGYGPFGLTALCYPSGIMRPAALLLHDHLTKESTA